MPTFTTIATAASLGITAATTAASFSQAGKQKKLMKEAEQSAAKALADAKNKLSVNYLESLSIQKEPYELQREALLSSGEQALRAATEGEGRGAAAIGGRVLQQQNLAQQDVRKTMGAELAAIDKVVAVEDARLAGLRANLDLEESQGAQEAAANAMEAQQASLAQGMSGLASFGSQLADLAPLYEKNRAADAFFEQNPEMTGDLMSSIINQPLINGVDFGGVHKMNPEQFKNFMYGLDPNTIRTLMSNISQPIQ